MIQRHASNERKKKSYLNSKLFRISIFFVNSLNIHFVYLRNMSMWFDHWHSITFNFPYRTFQFKIRKKKIVEKNSKINKWYFFVFFIELFRDANNLEFSTFISFHGHGNAVNSLMNWKVMWIQKANEGQQELEKVRH